MTRSTALLRYLNGAIRHTIWTHWSRHRASELTLPPQSSQVSETPNCQWIYNHWKHPSSCCRAPNQAIEGYRPFNSAELPP